MQTHGGAAAESAIMARERSFRIAVYVDWDGTGDAMQPLGELSDYVDNIAIERSLKGSAPDELLLIEGNSAAELSFTMGGEYKGMPFPSVFSRFNKISPLYGYRTVGAEITYQIIVDTPVGNFVYQQFVGTVRTIKPDRANNTVDVTALDKSELLRKPVQIPMWAMSEIAERWGELDSQVCWSHSVMDSALRLCDVGVAPKRPTFDEELDGRATVNEGVQFWLTGNGTYIPTLGWLDNPNIDCFPNRGELMYSEGEGELHPDAPAGSIRPQVFAGVGTANYAQAVPAREDDEGFLRYWPLDRNKIGAYGFYYFGMTLSNPAQAAAISGSYQLFEYYGPWSRIYRIMIGGGKLWIVKTFTRENGTVVTNTSGTINIPTNVSSADIFVATDNTIATGSRVFLKCGVNQLGWSAFGANNSEYAYNANNFSILGRITVNNIVDLADVFLCYRENPATTTAYQPDQCYRRPSNLAVLDRGLNRLSYIPDSSPTEAWTIVTDVAAAEHGSVMFDEQGVFRFLNRESLDTMSQVPVRSVTLDDMDSLSWTDNLDSVRNVFTVKANKKRAVYVPSAYSASDVNQFMTPGSQTKLFRVWINDIVSPLPWQMQRGFSQDLAGTWKYTNIHHNFIVQFLHPPGWNSGGTVTGEGWYEEGLQPGPVVICGFDGDGWMTVRVDNRSVLPIRFAGGVWTDPRANDTAAFNVVGTKIIDSGEQTVVVENQSSIAMYGPKTWELSGEWIQDTFNANNFVSTLMARTASPTPTTEEITIPSDPRLQLGDAITLEDAQGFGDNILVQILGINREWSVSEPFTDRLTIEIARTPEPPPKTEVPNPVPLVRRNMNPNPRLKSNATGWFNGTRVTNAQFSGSSTGYYATNRVITPQATVSEMGKQYTYSVWMWPSFTGLVTTELHWYDNGKYYSKGGSRNIPVVANVPVQLSVTAPAPSMAETALLNVIYSGNATFSMAMFERATYVNPGQVVATDPLAFFDGDTNPPATAWDGTAGNSTSTYMT